MSQYFRHKDKSIECEGLYHEPETEEHIQGKTLLYNWLKGLQDKGIISNVQLESYIKETKQRPDLYFEWNGYRYVIEFQCTPIATEYLKRRELYKLANIKDIWILGLEKYLIYGEDRKIEECGTQLKLDVTSKKVYTDGTLINNSLQYGVINFRKYRNFSLKDLTFKGKIVLSNKKLKPYIKRDNEKYENMKKALEKQEIQNEINKDIRKEAKEIANIIKRYNKDVKNRMDVRYVKSNKNRYTCRIEVFHSFKESKHLYFFFNDNGVSCSKRVLLDKKTGYSTFQYNGYCDYSKEFNSVDIIDFIKIKITEMSKEEC